MKQFFEEYGKTILVVVSITFVFAGWAVLKTDLGSLVISNVSAWFYDIDLGDVPEAPPVRDPGSESAILLAPPEAIKPRGSLLNPFALETVNDIEVEWTSIHNQIMYRVKLLDELNNVVYDSDLVYSNETKTIIHRLLLSKNNKYLWNVQIWNQEGDKSAPSENQYFLYTVPAEAIAGNIYLSMTRVDSICDGWAGGSTFELCNKATKLMRGTYNIKLEIYNHGSRYGSGCGTYRILLNGVVFKTENISLSTSVLIDNPREYIIPLTITEYDSTLEFWLKDNMCSGAPRAKNAYLGVADANGPYLEGRYWE